MSIVKFNAGNLAKKTTTLQQAGIGGFAKPAGSARLTRAHKVTPTTIIYGVDFTASTSDISSTFVSSVEQIYHEVGYEHPQYFGSFHGNGVEISDLGQSDFYQSQQNIMGHNNPDNFVARASILNPNIIILMLDGWEGNRPTVPENCTLVIIYDYNGGSGTGTFWNICQNITNPLGERGIAIDGLGSLNIKELIASLIEYQVQTPSGANSSSISFENFLKSKSNGSLPQISQKLLN